MKNEFSTIDSTNLDNVTGGAGAGPAIKKAAQWAWRNVGAPVAGGAAWQAASNWLGGGSNTSQQQAQPTQQPAQ